MHPHGCAAILWREGPYRCELWIIGGRGELRIFNDDQLTRVEALTPSGYARIRELRHQAIAHEGHRVDD